MHAALHVGGGVCKLRQPRRLGFPARVSLSCSRAGYAPSDVTGTRGRGIVSGGWNCAVSRGGEAIVADSSTPASRVPDSRVKKIKEIPPPPPLKNVTRPCNRVIQFVLFSEGVSSGKRRRQLYTSLSLSFPLLPSLSLSLSTTRR